MICVLSENTSPFYNLATEEYLLRNFSDDVFMTWRSESAVVVGKHQNTLAEIDYEYALKNGISIARRLTGGGTVYHDLGNINFTFVMNGKEGKLVDFGKFTGPVSEFLHSRNIAVKMGVKNDLVFNERKISGNAEHVFKSRTLHHGTILFDTDLKKMAGVIAGQSVKYTDKAVKSNRSQVTNLREYFDRRLSAEELMAELAGFMRNYYGIEKMYRFTGPEIVQIVNLVTSKYQTWDWIFGYSPAYRFKNSAETGTGSASIELYVEQGIIKEARLVSTLLDSTAAENLIRNITGRKHEYDSIKTVLSDLRDSLNLRDNTADKLMSAFF